MLADRLDLDGTPSHLVERFENRDLTDEGIDELLTEYRQDIRDPETDAEQPFKNALKELL